MSALDSDRKLFLPEEINFPHEKIEGNTDSNVNLVNNSLLHQILRNSNQGPLRPQAGGSPASQKRISGEYSTRFMPKRVVMDKLTLTDFNSSVPHQIEIPSLGMRGGNQMAPENVASKSHQLLSGLGKTQTYAEIL